MRAVAIMPEGGVCVSRATTEGGGRERGGSEKERDPGQVTLTWKASLCECFQLYSHGASFAGARFQTQGQASTESASHKLAFGHSCGASTGTDLAIRSRRHTIDT